TSGRATRPGERLVVIDIGGGSTELVVGAGGAVRVHVSTQAGGGGQTGRPPRPHPPPAGPGGGPPAGGRGVLAARPPGGGRGGRDAIDLAIAVAGTATSLAAIDLDLEPYDPERVHGHVLTRATVARQLERLGALPLAERRAVRGLHPDRAPTIVAGAALLREA